ncbi:hypothetical protein GG851_02810 [Bordetella petrii]|nr:hypothetical protein [Bordetella petrii]
MDDVNLLTVPVADTPLDAPSLPMAKEPFTKVPPRPFALQVPERLQDLLKKK